MEQKHILWIIGIIVFFSFIAAAVTISDLKTDGFKRKKLFLPLAKIHMIYFTPIKNQKPDEETVNQLELMLTNAGYHGSAFTRNKQFDDLAADLGYHHIVFTEDL